MPKAPGHYSPIAVALHWSVFALIVVVGTLGLLHDSWPDASQAYWINMHAVLGLLMWSLVMVRLLWRWSHEPPALPADVDALSRRLSGPVHALLYLLMLTIPIIGIVTFVWHGRVFDFGLFQVNFGVAKNRAIFHPTEDIHGYMAYALFGLAALHILAALWHQFVRKDGLMQRMSLGKGNRA